MKELVNILIEKEKTISTMESCTGGAIVNAITNIPNASRVLTFAAVTYSNEAKIKMGVNEEIIQKYSVYSPEVAIEMSKAISKYTKSNYGIGVTGKLNAPDPKNLFGDNSVVYINIYDQKQNKNYSEEIKLQENTREKNKEEIINKIVDKMLEILK